MWIGANLMEVEFYLMCIRYHYIQHIVRSNYVKCSFIICPQLNLLWMCRPSAANWLASCCRRPCVVTQTLLHCAAPEHTAAADDTGEVTVVKMQNWRGRGSSEGAEACFSALSGSIKLLRLFTPCRDSFQGIQLDKRRTEPVFCSVWCLATVYNQVTNNKYSIFISTSFFSFARTFEMNQAELPELMGGYLLFSEAPSNDF